MRPLLAAVIGTGVVVVAALPAVATGPSSPTWPELDRGPARASARATYVVHPGDTLWGIARRHLDARASGRAVARAWPAWYAVNRRVIGPDPDLIRPGQRLRTPAGARR